MTDVALASPLPEVPPSIQQLLAQLNLAYRPIPATTRLPQANRVHTVLLSDSVGMLLVLLPEDQLLDLRRLVEFTGRQLTVVAPERLMRTLERYELDVLPGLPSLTNSPCLYDERLLEAPRLLLESGERSLLLEVETSDYRRLLNQATAGSFGIPAAGIQPNLRQPERDEAEILHAATAFTARRIRQRLEETLEIPPLSKTAEKVIKLRVDPEATVDDLANVVETDPALAAQVISWAASPYYAAPGKIRSVEDAIVRVLGFDLVINLALGLALGKTLSLPSDQAQQETPYWKQAIYTAALIEGLARSMPRAERPEMGLAYLGGLLHNFGYLVLAHVFPPHFSLICRHLEANRQLDHQVIEHHLLGITREQIGAALMRCWEMPEEVVTALRFQGDPGYQGEQAVYPNLIFLAVQLLRAEGIGNGPAQPIPDELYARLSIDPAKARECMQKILGAEAALRELTGQFK